MSVQSRTRGNLREADGAPEPVQIDWSYVATDPYAVSMTVTADSQPDVHVTWVLSRDLLWAALTTPGVLFGAGDVTYRRVVMALGLDLDNGARTCTVLTRASVAYFFLLRTQQLVPFGKEFVDVDSAIARCLEAAS